MRLLYSEEIKAHESKAYNKENKKKKKKKKNRLSFIVSVEDYYFNETLLTPTSANFYLLIIQIIHKMGAMIPKN